MRILGSSIWEKGEVWWREEAADPNICMDRWNMKWEVFKEYQSQVNRMQSNARDRPGGVGLIRATRWVMGIRHFEEAWQSIHSTGGTVLVHFRIIFFEESAPGRAVSFWKSQVETRGSHLENKCIHCGVSVFKRQIHQNQSHLSVLNGPQGIGNFPPWRTGLWICLENIPNELIRQSLAYLTKANLPIQDMPSPIVGPPEISGFL